MSPCSTAERGNATGVFQGFENVLPILNWSRRDEQTCVNSVIGCEIDTLHFPRFIGRLKEHQVRVRMCSKQRSGIRKALNKLHIERVAKKTIAFEQCGLP